MAAKPKKKPGIAVWLVLGLLAFALVGFGPANFGGSVRSVGTVGDTEIPANDYALALQNTLRARAAQGNAVSLSTVEGQQIAAAVQGQLIADAALENEAARLGLSIGDELLREQILSMPAFQGLSGSFDRAAYGEVLRRAGLNERDFEDGIRSDAASDLISAAAVSGINAHESMVELVAAHYGERREMKWLQVEAEALETPLPDPTEAELQAVYEANPEAYTEPEKKEITYVALTPEMMLGEIEIDEDELRRLYDARSTEFIRPERRLVERLVFPDQAAADAAREALDGGATFESLVQGRGLSLIDVDMGDVTQADLGAAGEPVFALEEPGVVGPLETALGPALFRVNVIVEAQTTPFDEARDDLAAEASTDRARREIDARRDDIDDLLAAGATLEEIAQETAMELGSITVGPDTAEGIAAYAAFRDAASEATPDDFPDLIVLEDGGLAALRVDALLAPALLPLEDVRDRVVADWTADEIDAKLGDLGEDIRAAVLAGQTLEDQGYEPELRDGIARESFIDGAPDGMVDTLFALEEGGVEVFAEDGTLHVVQLTRIVPLGDDEEAEALRASLSANIARSASDEALTLFVRALEAEAGLTLNPSAINAVHANFP